MSFDWVYTWGRHRHLDLLQLQFRIANVLCRAMPTRDQPSRRTRQMIDEVQEKETLQPMRAATSSSVLALPPELTAHCMQSTLFCPSQAIAGWDEESTPLVDEYDINCSALEMQPLPPQSLVCRKQTNRNKRTHDAVV